MPESINTLGIRVKEAVGPRWRLRDGPGKSVLTFSALALVVGCLSLALSATVSESSPGVAGIGVALFFLGCAVVAVLCIAGPRGFGVAIVVLLASHFLMFVGRPLYAVLYQGSQNIFTGSPYEVNFLWAEVIAGIGVLCLSIGYGTGFRTGLKRGPVANQWKPAVEPFDRTDWLRLRPYLFCAMSAGLGLYIIYIGQFGWTSYLQATLGGRSEQYWKDIYASSGYLQSGLQFATGVVVLFFFQAKLIGHRSQLFWFCFLILLSFPQIASGSRSAFIPLAITIMIVLNRAKPGLITFRRIIIWLPGAFVLGIVAPRIWREALSRGGSIGESVVQALTPDQLFGGFVGGLDTAMVDSFALQIQAQRDGVLQLQNGETYLAALVSWVPRELWSGKPVSVDEILNMTLFPETAAKKIGFAFSFYSEPMFNFGVFGVCVVAMLCGFVLGRFNATLQSSHSLPQIYVSATIIAYSFVIMRGNLTYDLQRALILLLPVLASLALASITPQEGAIKRARGKIRMLNRK